MMNDVVGKENGSFLTANNNRSGRLNPFITGTQVAAWRVKHLVYALCPSPHPRPRHSHLLMWRARDELQFSWISRWRRENSPAEQL